MKRKIGVGLIVLANLVLVFIALTSPGYARAAPNMDPVMRGAYASPWTLALTAVLALFGFVLALVPIRRGERWAGWTLIAGAAILMSVRFATDPRCMVVLDPHQHGCHTILIWALLTVIGAVLAIVGK